jgi:hypothetical protein
MKGTLLTGLRSMMPSVSRSRFRRRPCKLPILSALRQRLAPCLAEDLAVSFYVLGVGFYL